MLPPSSLIIPTRNRPDLLRDTVSSVLDGDEVPTEMIVVDQSDTRDDSVAAMGTVRGCEVRYVWEPDKGVSKARNIAMRLARYDVLAFADADVRVEPTWFGTLLRALLDAGPRAVVTGRVWPEASAPGGFVPSTKIDPAPARYEGRIGADVLFSGNMAFPRSVCESVGDFDERLGPGAPFPAAEDNDFGFRVLEAGYSIIYAPEAGLYHRAWRSADGYVPLRWAYGLGQGAYYAKHVDLRDRYMLRRIAGDIGKRVLTLPYLLVYRRRQAYGNVVFATGVLVGAARWLLTRPDVPGAPPVCAPTPRPVPDAD